VEEVDTYVLNDGTKVEIRPIRADDGERLQLAHERLSPETRYRRYLGAKPTLSPDDTRYLVEVDGADHVALVATDTVDGEPGAIVAVARFVRLPHDPTAAEFAIVVGDLYQKQGLGTELVRRLTAAALERGVTHFRATTLADNLGLLALLQAVAAPGQMTTEPRGSIADVDVWLAVPARLERRRTNAVPGRRRAA
jgi:RimJ/RimL family protein N-acetyltransferase